MSEELKPEIWGDYLKIYLDLEGDLSFSRAKVMSVLPGSIARGRRTIEFGGLEMDVVILNKARNGVGDDGFLDWGVGLEVFRAKFMNRDEFISKVLDAVFLLRKANFGVVVASDFEDKFKSP